MYRGNCFAPLQWSFKSVSRGLGGRPWRPLVHSAAAAKQQGPGASTPPLRHFQSNAPPGAVTGPTYRELFVWDRSFTQDLFSCHERDLKHPSSGHHALAAYATEFHRQRSYNFNNSMEFELFMSAIQPQRADSHGHATDSQSDRLHDVLIWPDRLWVQNLRLIDVPEVLRLAMNPVSIDATGPSIGESKTERLRGIHVLSCNGGSSTNIHSAATSLSLCLGAIEDSALLSIQELRSQGVHGWKASSVRGFVPNRLLLLPMEHSDLHVASPAATRELVQDAAASLNHGKR